MIVYIHGASATAESFTYIRQFVRGHFKKEIDIMLEYESRNGFENNLEEMKKNLLDKERLFFICHSLGGIYGLYLANHFKEKTIGGITLSTPYGGSAEADFARYFLPFSQLMKDIGTIDGPLRNSRHLDAPPNWTQIVTTAGRSPWILSDNDGVVTLKSMRFREDFETVDVHLNHYEVVISNRVVEIIIERIVKSLK